MNDKIIAIAKELAFVVITVVALDLSAAFLAISHDPGVLLSDPTAWAVGIGRSIVAKLLPALAVKVREIVVGFFNLLS